MADAAEAASPPAKKKLGGIVGTLINGVGIFVLTLGAVVAGGFVNAKLHPAPDYKIADGKATAIAPAGGGGGHSQEVAKTDNYFAIDPPLVVNFEDGSAVRFLQITAEVMAKDPKSIDGIKANLPLVRNNLLLVIGNRDFQSLMTRDGKEKLRSDALAELRSIAKKESLPEPDDLLFTSFVVQ